MSDESGAGLTPEKREDVFRARNRVVDHWKRLFAIICGFAITVACLRAYTCVLEKDWTGLLQFFALMVTIPPVFHGIERSLDVRYLQSTSPIPGAGRLIIDTAILMLTALFFLGLALNIPDLSVQWWAERAIVLRRRFLLLLVLFFLFDFVVLLVARKLLREGGAGGEHLSTHARLAVINLLAGLAVGVGMFSGAAVARYFGVDGWLASRGFEAPVVAAALIAVGRTILDYPVSRRFLYPQENLA
jgi:hypothetical protein